MSFLTNPPGKGFVLPLAVALTAALFLGGLFPDSAEAQGAKRHRGGQTAPSEGSGRLRLPDGWVPSIPLRRHDRVVEAVPAAPDVIDFQSPLPRYSDWYYAYEEIITSRIDGWAKEIDSAAKTVDRWGYASATGLILIEDTPVGRVGFEYDRTFRENFEDAGRVQGAASNLIEKSRSLSVGVGGAEPPSSQTFQIIGFNEVPILENGVDTGQTERVPIYGTPSGQAGGVENFSGAGSLLPGGADASGKVRFEGKLSVDDLQTGAASTTVSGRLLEMMAHPTGMPENTKAFLGVTQISVSPGWKTGANYVCEVTVSVNYGSKHDYSGLPVSEADIRFFGSEDVARQQLADLDKIKGADPYDYETPPLIYSAFPLAKQQVLDLRHSFRQQTELLMAAQASAVEAGNIGAAKAAGRMMKKIQHDVATKNALPVVVPSSNGRFISYRFDPTLYGLAQPANASSKAGSQLKAMSIPALVVILCHEKDLEKFKTIRLQSSTRWIPIKDRHPILQIPTRPRRLQAETTFDGAERLDRVHREMMEVYQGITDNLMPDEKKRLLIGFDTTYSSLLSRVSELSQKVATSFLDVPLPEVENTYLEVTPGKVTLAQVAHEGETVFTITGEQLCNVLPVMETHVSAGMHEEGGASEVGHAEVIAFLGGTKLLNIYTAEDVIVCQLPSNSGLPVGKHDLIVVSNKGVRKAPGAVEVLAAPETVSLNKQEYLDALRAVTKFRNSDLCQADASSQEAADLLLGYAGREYAEDNLSLAKRDLEGAARALGMDTANAAVFNVFWGSAGPGL